METPTRANMAKWEMRVEMWLWEGGVLFYTEIGKEERKKLLAEQSNARSDQFSSGTNFSKNIPNTRSDQFVRLRGGRQHGFPPFFSFFLFSYQDGRYDPLTPFPSVPPPLFFLTFRITDWV